MDQFKDDETIANDEDRHIRGSILYYNTNQVAQLLGVPDSTIRYYSKVLDSILNIEIINKQRKYKQGDIDKLRFIIQLKEEGMSIKQIQEYCSSVKIDSNGEVQIAPTNPLSIQTVAKALMEEQERQIIAMENRILQRMDEYMQSQISMNRNSLDEIKREVATTVDDVVNDKMNEIKEEFKITNEKIDKMAYVSAEEIKKQKKDKPNKWWLKFTGRDL